MNGRYSSKRQEQMKRQYLASKVLGIPAIGTESAMNIIDYKNRYHSNGKPDSLITSPYKALRHRKFTKNSTRKFNINKAIKHIKVLKSLGVKSEQLFSYLTYSDAAYRCLSELKNRYKSELIKRADNIAKLNQKIPFSVKLSKYKNQFKPNMVKTPLETIYESKDFVGVEIEFITSSGETSLKQQAEKLKIKNFNIGSDSSIEVDSDENPDDMGHEIRILLQNNEQYIDKELKKLCTLLSNNDAYVNKSCGLHIHLDMRHKTQDEQVEIGERFSKALSVLSSLVPRSRRENSYCKLRKSYDDRYVAINMSALRKYGTIEIRLHSGTVDFLKIKNWIKLLNIIKDTKNSKSLKSFDEMMEVLKLPDDLAIFYYNRYKKFNSDKLAEFNDETSLSESSVLTIDQITFNESNNSNQSASA